MRKPLATLLIAVTLLVGVMIAPVQAGGRVRCEIPSSYRVVCFNYTPYVVRVRLNIYTTNGLYVRYFRMPYTRRVVWSPAYINRITWRWWYV